MKKLYATAVKCIVSFRDFFLGLLGLFCLVMAVAMAIGDRLPAAGLLFTAGLILSVFSSLSRFEFIKGLGIEARMREIDKKVDHVEQLAEKVAKTSTVTAEFCMDVMSRIGRFSGPMPREVGLRLVRDMSTQLQSLGVEQAVVDKLLAPWRDMVMFDLVGVARDSLHDAMLRLQQEIDQIVKDISKPIDTSSERYSEYERRRQEANTWHTRINEIWNRRRGVGQIKLLDEVYKGLTGRYGRSIIVDPDAAEEAIRHGMYFAVHKDFLDEKYWIDADPQKEQLHRGGS